MSEEKELKIETRLSEAREELRDLRAQLAESEKMATLGSLIAGIAHEINTPLAALVSNTDLFLRSVAKFKCEIDIESLSPEAQQLLEGIDAAGEVSAEAAKRIVAIVTSLRTFARHDPAEMEAVDIHEGLDSTLTLAHHTLKNRIEVVRNYGDLPAIKCYPIRLNQVFLNIIVNAAQAIENKGEIRITTRKEGSKVVIEISDNGSGMTPEVRAQIFEPGFTTKGSGIGTGLGLSIVKQIIEKHKGALEVESKPGQGSTFRIILPIEP